MKTFKEYAKKRKRKDNLTDPPTVVSSPLRGPNQDYGGVGVKGDVADYTISDNYKPRK